MLRTRAAKSKSVSVTVKRKGPNCPKITSAKNNAFEIKGNINDTHTKVYAVIGKMCIFQKFRNFLL